MKNINKNSITMQKGFGFIGILIVIGIIAGIGAFVFTSVFPDQNPFMLNTEEKSAIDMAEQMKEAMEGKNNETMPLTNTVGDETANWKTYRNDEYGFEVKFPPGWELKESGDKKLEFSFGEVDNAYAFGGINIISDPSLFFKDSLDLSTCSIKLPDADGYEKILIGGYEACHSGRTRGGDGAKIYIPKGEVVIEFEYTLSFGSKVDYPDLEKIISTLRFTK